MSEFIFVSANDMFHKKWWIFKKFNSEKFERTCLFILDKKPIKIWGDWYYVPKQN